MPSPGGGQTVAEQVAALPPLSQLLGMDVAGTSGSKRVGRRHNNPVNTMVADATKLGVSRTATSRKKAAPLQPLSTPSPLADTASAAPSNTEKLLPSPVRYPGGLAEWRHVQSTLQLPLAYRGEDDIKLTLRLLRSLPFFASLLDHDLLTLTETMTVVEVPDAGTVVLRKAANPLRATTTTTTTSTTAAPVTAIPTSAAAELRSGGAGLSDDDDDGSGGGRRADWNVPAADLFEHFRAQIARGDPPSLPAVCLEGQTKTSATSSASRRSRPSAAAADVLPRLASVAERRDEDGMDAAKPALFQVPDGWLDGGDVGGGGGGSSEGDAEEPFVVVLLSGHCELRWPRQRGPADAANAPDHHAFLVLPGDAIGYALLWDALPPGAQYVTADTCTLLKVCVEGHTHEIRERLHRACNRANEVVYKAQRSYLAEQLRVPLFADHAAAAEARDGGELGTAEVRAESEKQITVAGSWHSSTRPNAVATPPPPTSSPAAPSALAAYLDLAARQLIPVRVPGETTLLQEGLTPATECALYFVVEGGCSVVRRVWSQDQQRLEARKAQLVKELTLPNGDRPVLATMPSTTTMEVAQLRPGDYCGDLAYLRIDPDNATSIDAEWTAAYWHHTFLSGGPDNRGGDGEEEEREDASGLASTLRARREQQPSGTSAAGEAAESRSQFRRHKASIITQRSTQMYVLLPTAAAQCIRGVVLDRIREHALAYPSYAALLAEYEKMYKWAIYKEKVLYNESKKISANLR